MRTFLNAAILLTLCLLFPNAIFPEGTNYLVFILAVGIVLCFIQDVKEIIRK